MRKLMLSLLLAGAAATPALAGPRDDHSDRHQAREERQQVREERQQVREERQQMREERVAPAERPQFNGQATERMNAARLQQQQRVAQQQQRVARQQQARFGEARLEAMRAAQAQRRNGDAPNSVRDWRRDRSGGDLRQQVRPVPQVFRNRVPIVSNTPRVGTQPPLRVERRRTPEVRWSNNWRHDRRYDWRNWRDRHRSSFHLGFYYDPFGWGYQPYSVGWRLWPNYYSSNFWINDPWQYRLPYAPPGTRWIRYYNDAILVDTWNGQVVDVIYNFFW